MRYHSNATTNISQRQYIKQSSKSSRDLANELKVSHVTCNKWIRADQIKDRPCRPHNIHYVLSKADERIIISIRDKTLLSIDDLLDALEPYFPNLTRSTLYRTLCRYRRNRLAKDEKSKSKQFAKYDPGFVHIDILDLPVINRKKYYCFLAVDRVTRMIFLEVYERKTKREAADFLIKCLSFFPFRIHTILTDNGRQFVMHNQTSFGKRCKSRTLFEIICQLAGIRTRTTKPYHPWTNGMAERMVRTVKEHTIRIERYGSPQELIDSIRKFEQYHNCYRKLRVIGKKTPMQLAIEWHSKKPEIFISNPTEIC